jgi:hypothetical protein
MIVPTRAVCLWPFVSKSRWSYDRGTGVHASAVVDAFPHPAATTATAMHTDPGRTRKRRTTISILMTGRALLNPYA